MVIDAKNDEREEYYAGYGGASDNDRCCFRFEEFIFKNIMCFPSSLQLYC